MVPSKVLSLLAFATMAACAEDATFDRAILPVLKTSCAPCHHSHLASGGLMLEEFMSPESLKTQREAWERITKRVRNGQMPPGKDKPAGLPEFVAFLEKALGLTPP